MGVYKIVRVIERIEYVKADDEVAAQSPLRSNHTEIVTDERVVSEVCEEVDEAEARLYWANKNSR